MSSPQPSASELSPEEAGPIRLRDAIRVARVEQAEQTGVVIDLRDADVARLEILNEALKPIFSAIPAPVELFDRGISHGETPRLWVDSVAHVAMARDKRTYRFLQDSRAGRKILAESDNVADIVTAMTRYVARRLVERERMLAGSAVAALDPAPTRSRAWRFARMTGIFILGVAAGMALLMLAAYVAASGMLGH